MPLRRPLAVATMCAVLAAAAAAVLAAVVAPRSTAAAAPPSSASAAGVLDVVLVANAEDGTVSIVDAATFSVVAELDVLPDGPEAELGEDDPVQALIGQRIVEAAGGDNWVQDQDLAPDGRTLYVSRGHRGDVAAFDVSTGELRWKTPITGVRADHMTISGDGSRLYVSALTADLLEVLDTATGQVVGQARTGEWPHDNHLSDDGARLYNASIGNILTPFEVREARAAVPGASPYQVVVYDAATLEVLDTHDFGAGVRPFALDDDERLLYAQLSEHHGVVEYDLEAREITRDLDLPMDDGVTEEDYDFEAPHHGLALSADGSTLCLAGRASDYAALVDTEAMELTAIIDVGDAPSWAETTPDGTHCVLANNREGTVSFVSYATAVEVARVEVGAGPKHLVSARIPAEVLAAASGEAPAGGAEEAPADDGQGSGADDADRPAVHPAAPPLPATGGTALPAAASALLLGSGLLAAGRRPPPCRRPPRRRPPRRRPPRRP